MTIHSEAPRVRIHTLDGSYLQLATTPAEDVMSIIDTLESEEGVLSFDLDNGRSQVYIPCVSVARMDVDWELTWFARLRTKLLCYRDRIF